MLEEFKNILLAGIGSAAYTYEKANELIDNMVEKGKLTIDEGKDLSQELKRTISNKTKETPKKVKPLTKEDIKEILSQMNFATKSDLEQIEDRISKLETKQ
ncbi:hypothetical protein SH2C18_49740 [Clostridium sediminicola]|uniref:phasin family protein n=1 Tax=Clostridium sediminicola TaxID=3114879 RepID=UPI0031F1D17D